MTDGERILGMKRDVMLDLQKKGQVSHLLDDLSEEDMKLLDSMEGATIKLARRRILGKDVTMVKIQKEAPKVKELEQKELEDHATGPEKDKVTEEDRMMLRNEINTDIKFTNPEPCGGKIHGWQLPPPPPPSALPFWVEEENKAEEKKCRGCKDLESKCSCTESCETCMKTLAPEKQRTKEAAEDAKKLNLCDCVEEIPGKRRKVERELGAPDAEPRVEEPPVKKYDKFEKMGGRYADRTLKRFGSWCAMNECDPPVWMRNSGMACPGCREKGRRRIAEKEENRKHHEAKVREHLVVLDRVKRMQEMNKQKEKDEAEAKNGNR